MRPEMGTPRKGRPAQPGTPAHKQHSRAKRHNNKLERKCTNGYQNTTSQNTTHSNKQGLPANSKEPPAQQQTTPNVETQQQTSTTPTSKQASTATNKTPAQQATNQNSNSLAPRNSASAVLKPDKDVDSTTQEGKEFQTITCLTLKNLFLLSVAQYGTASLKL